jgi:hypothetical protein
MAFEDDSKVILVKSKNSRRTTTTASSATFTLSPVKEPVLQSVAAAAATEVLPAHRLSQILSSGR